MEERLQKFAKVVETGSVTRAAKELRISQPALSTALHKLERELKTELIAHTGRTIQITSAGYAAYRTARSIDAKLQDLQQELAAHRGQKPLLRIGMIDSLAELLCISGDLLQSLETTTNTSLMVDNSAHLLQAVRQGNVDVALVAGGIHKISTLILAKVGSEPLLLVAHTSQLAGVQAQFAKGNIHNFLAYSPASNTFELIARHFASNGIHLSHAFHSTSPEVILRLVLAGRGTAVLPLQMIQTNLQSGILSPVTAKIISRPIVAILDKNRQQTQNVNICIEHAKRSLTQLNKIARLIAQTAVGML